MFNNTRLKNFHKAENSGNESFTDSLWFEVYLKACISKPLTKEQIKLLNALWTNTSYPDVRLWNNRVAGLSGSSKSTPELGLTAALSVSDATIYGGNPGVKAISFLLKADKDIQAGVSLQEVVKQEIKHSKIYGYGRPINSIDERLDWITKIAQDLGLASGKFVALAKNVEKILLQKSQALKMNYSALSAALCADMGFNAREYQKFRLPLLLAGMTPCYIEASNHKSNTLFALDCEDVSYNGASKRNWTQRSGK